jgi:type II secretory pathway component PulK
MLLSALVVEFAYDTNVTYNIAMNERDRLQAFYLAQSAVNFSKIVIKYDKEAKQLVSQASQKLGRSIQVKPLYQMIPINSALLRTFLQNPGPEGEGAAAPPAEGEGADQTQEAQKTLGNVDVKETQTFLDFEGDFNATVEAEDGKLSLNAFFTLNPTQREYDRLKDTLRFLLMQKPFEGFLKDPMSDSQELAGKIADFIDKNDVINEYKGEERGPESGIYVGTSQKPKNAKLLTADELILVPGMTDDILTELKKHVTVYKSTDKINACLASDELLRAMILAFTQREDIEPLRPDNEERLKNAMDKVREKCPDTQAMSQALNDVLGISASGSSGSGTAPASSQPSTQPAGGTSGGVSFTSFSSMINSEEMVFKIEATGTLGNAEVKIIDILQAGSNNPDQWKDLFWRVE